MIIIIIVILIFCKHYHSPMVDYFYESLSRPLPDRRSTKRLKSRRFNVPVLDYTFVLLPFTLVSLVTRRLRGATSTIGSSQRDGDISPLPACLSLYRFFHFYIVIDIS